MRRLLSAITFCALIVLATVVPSSQSYTISPPPFLIAQNNSGAIINNACIWSYTAGTLTAATTYSDNVGTPNLNPIRSDSAGRFTAFLVPGSSYKFVYESSCVPPAHGTTLRTADNIAAMPASAGNTDVLGTAGENLTAGQAVYLSNGDGSKVAGLFYKADAGNAYSSSNYWVGIATVAITSGSTGLIRLGGSVTGLTGLTVSQIYYVGSSGALTATLPANARPVGQADTATSIVMNANPPPFYVSANGVPTTSAANGSILIGRASDRTLQLGQLTAGNGVSIVGTSGAITISTGTFGHTTTTAANPSGTTDLTGKMMGLAGSITPMSTGTVLFCMAGTLANDTSPDGAFVQLTRGTGAAPTNGAALTGTAIGSVEVLSIIASNTQRSPFGGCALSTGLATNTPVWYDIRLAALAGGTATATSVVLTAVELP